jgi:membrane protease YdiL (CAAX protease family)
MVAAMEAQESGAPRPAIVLPAAPPKPALRLVPRAHTELIALLALFLITLAVSFATGKSVFVFAYIMTVVVAVGGPRRHGRPWSDIGVKGGSFGDLRRVWPLSALVAVVFQVLPPTVGVAFVTGNGPELLAHITGRLPVDLGSTAGVLAIVTLLAAALVLTLVEEIVYRAVFQERMSWYVGTPAAIAGAAILFGLAHAVGATGSPQVVAIDVSGVILDGLLFGLIYARTHNLWVTWATHYAADVVGVIVLVTVFRAV